MSWMGSEDADAKVQDLRSPVKRVTAALPQNAKLGDIIVHVDGKNHAISQDDVGFVIKVDRDEHGTLISLDARILSSILAALHIEHSPPYGSTPLED